MAIELHIERLSKSGDGVARHGGRTVFVEGALPGERVRAHLHQGKVLRADLLEVLEASPSRRPPPCALAERCGGCSWMHLDEPAQRAAKEEIVASALEHEAGIGRGAYRLEPTAVGAHALGYRRRASLVPVDRGWGFSGRRSHQRVRADRCPALVPELAELRFELPPDVDELRLVSDGGVGVSLHLKGPIRPGLRNRAQALLDQVQSVVLVPREGPCQVLGDRGIRADLFAQANAEVNALLVEAAGRALGSGGPALELYAGSGNLTRALAAPVTAVEVSGGACEVPQVRWIRGDVPRVVAGLLAERARFDRLLLDPPRSGAQGVGGWADRFGVKRVVYVACDPAALARDAAELLRQGFRPVSLQLFDMFPQTHHVEALMSFDR